MRPVLICLLLAVTTPLLAEEAVPPPPSIPAEVGAVGVEPLVDEGLQPEVRIRQTKEGGVAKEYRINGRLYLVKITPRVGPPYYLIDSDGDGSLETRRSELDSPETVMWRLLKW